MRTLQFAQRDAAVQCPNEYEVGRAAVGSREILRQVAQIRAGNREILGVGEQQIGYTLDGAARQPRHQRHDLHGRVGFRLRPLPRLADRGAGLGEINGDFRRIDGGTGESHRQGTVVVEAFAKVDRDGQGDRTV